MSRPTLRIARKPTPPKGPSLSLVKKAIRLFRGRGIPKDVYRANAKKWLAANAALGDNHLLRGASATWGQPGHVKVEQVFAPRRLGQR